MLTRSGGDHSRRVATTVIDKVAACENHGAGLYLTNEVFLYRVVGIAPSDIGAIVELEDCYMLDVVRVPLEAVRACRLRVVTAARTDD